MQATKRSTAVAATDQQPARLQRVAVVGVTDHLGEGAVGEGEHRPKGSEAVVAEVDRYPSHAMSPSSPTSEDRKLIASNRKARHDYAILDTIETGIVLQGSEVKSLRLGHLQMADAYARVINGAIWLDGIHIPPYQFAHGVGVPRSRSVRASCCCTRREIERIAAEVALERLSLVPLSFYFKDGKVKVELALGTRSPQGRQAQRDGRTRRAARHGNGPWAARPRAAPTESSCRLMASDGVVASARVCALTTLPEFGPSESDHLERCLRRGARPSPRSPRRCPAARR